MRAKYKPWHIRWCLDPSGGASIHHLPYVHCGHTTMHKDNRCIQLSHADPHSSFRTSVLVCPTYLDRRTPHHTVLSTIITVHNQPFDYLIYLEIATSSRFPDVHHGMPLRRDFILQVWLWYNPYDNNIKDSMHNMHQKEQHNNDGVRLCLNKEKSLLIFQPISTKKQESSRNVDASKNSGAGQWRCSYGNSS